MGQRKGRTDDVYAAESILRCCRPSASSCSGTDDSSEEVGSIRIIYRKMIEKEII